jgi:hypothetical protein
LLRFLAAQRGLQLHDSDFSVVEKLLPDWLTPGAAEALAVKAYRAHRIGQESAVAALLACLEGYRPPVSRDILEFQMRIAIAEASDPSFVPPSFRMLGGGTQ